MKLPVWAWDELEQKYKPFPFHLLETFEDGTQGISIPPLQYFRSGQISPNNIEKKLAVERFKRGFYLTPLSKLFDSDTTTQRYILKHQKGQCRHRAVMDWEEIGAFGMIGVFGAVVIAMLVILIYGAGTTIADHLIRTPRP